MNPPKPRILLTNDDGVHAEGLVPLARALETVGELRICAPLFERSGSGCSLTIRRSLQVAQVSLDHDLNTWTTDGSPVDCVKFAVSNLYPSEAPPDLVVSGINTGLNLATHIFYSGTVGAALEAAFLGIPSLAVSMGGLGRPPGDPPAEGALENAVRYTVRLARTIHAQKMPPGCCLNVNIPNLPPAELTGVRFTRHGQFRFNTRYHPDEEGDWRLGGLMSGFEEPPPPGLDYTAIREGAVSITVLDVDLNNDWLLGRFGGWGLEGMLQA